MPLSPSLLVPGQAHLFLARPEVLLLAAPQHAGWLSQEERAREKRYRRPGDGALYRATRALVRGVLSGLCGQKASALAFVELAHGRPVLPEGTATLDFNASRSRAWVALVVTAGAACGVDVEDCRREADMLGIARAFAPEERAFLLEATPAERRRRFFALWTLKEATLKALGTGLTASLGACAFRLQPGQPPAVRFGPGVQEDSAEWGFAQCEPDAAHLLAVAVRSGGPLDIVLHDEVETSATVAQVA
ncbi:MAG: 4'-phosphopantetheinyl transferase family protein [Myxococcaceae bacterium]